MDAETRTYLDDMRQEIRTLGESLRAEMRQGDAETRNQLGAMIEAQRHDLAAVAEGVAANTVAIDRLRRDMGDRFEAVRTAFVGVRRDIDALRARP